MCMYCTFRKEETGSTFRPNAARIASAAAADIGSSA